MSNLFRFSAWSITTKLIVIMALVAALPAAVVGIVIAINNTQATTQQVQGWVSGIGEAEDTYIETWVSERFQDVKTLASLTDIQHFKQDEAAAQTAIDEYQKLWGIYESISVIDVNGITHINSDHQVINTADREYFKQAITGKSFVNPPVVSRGTGNVVLIFASPVVLEGKIVGVMIVNVPVNEVSAILNKTNLGSTGEAYLVDGKGLTITDLKHQQELVDQKIIKDTPILTYQMDTYATQQLKGMDESVEGISTYRNYVGKQVIGARYWIADLNLGLIIEREQSEIMAPIIRANTIATVVTLVAVLLAILVAFLVARLLTTQVRHIMTLFSEIGIGNFTARAQVVSEDELGTMALSLNAVLDNILSLIQTREQRDEIQTAIMKLLDEVSGVADGDLTREAEVTADMTGAIADSFNYMIGELRQIIKSVQSTTLEVSGSAAEIQTTAEHLSLGSEDQARQIIQTSQAVQEMSASIAQVSENAALSANVSQQALSSAQQGARAVQNTIEGMNRIRGQVQETAKRIKRLGESSQEIGEIVQLIEDIADRTSILALNASIQAAMAGEAGRGFAVVAEEVERLAERSTGATKQIANLIKTTQSETTEAVAAMETTTRDVVEGSVLADQAGKALNEIEIVANQLADLIQSISAAAKQQSRGSESLARSMMEISEVTQQTAAGTRQAAVSINDLASLADQLRSSVSRFKLPSNGHSNN